MARNNSSVLKGAGYLVTATFIYGLFGILSRTVGLSIPIFYQNATRNLTAAIILVFIVTAQHAWKPVSKRDFWILFWRTVAGSVAFLAYFYTILKIPFGTAYFIFYAGSVVFGYIAGHFWFSEHLTKVKVFSLALAMLGLLLVYQVNISVMTPLYFGLALLSGVTTAIWDVISKKISGSYAASYISFWDEALSVVNYGLASILVGEHWSIPTLSFPWAASLGMGVFFVATGILVVTGFKYVEAQIGSIIMLAEIIFAILVGWMFYGETITLMTAVGGMFIVTAIVLPELYAAKKIPRV
jgi:drug/metabolite transporter (DMT)-like permease